jgi:peptide/nickel transport system substrate-binding protein
VVATAAIGVVKAQQTAPEIIFANWGYLWSPAIPLWNCFAPNNLYWPSAMPLAILSSPTGQLWPVLAKSWVLFPQNKTMIIYLRKGLYWFNGSATMPFTAWDSMHTST